MRVKRLLVRALAIATMNVAVVSLMAKPAHAARGGYGCSDIYIAGCNCIWVGDCFEDGLSDPYLCECID